MLRQTEPKREEKRGETKRRIAARRASEYARARILVCRYTEFYAPRRRSRLTIDRDGQILCGPARKFRLYIRAREIFPSRGVEPVGLGSRLRRCKFSGNTSVRARARISLPFSYFFHFPFFSLFLLFFTSRHVSRRIRSLISVRALPAIECARVW